MSPPPPPEAMVPRTDAGARKLIEKQELFERRITERLAAIEEQQDKTLEQLKEMVGEMKRMDGEMKDRPKEARLFAILGGCAIGVLGFVMVLINAGKNDTEKVFKAQTEVLKLEVTSIVEKASHTQALELREFYRVAPRKMRSPLLERPPPARDGGTEDDS